MKCSKHYERDAVSQCVDCGKALCPECTEKFTVPLCDQCALNRINADKQLLVKNSIIMIVLFIIGFLWSGQESFFQRILLGYFFCRNSLGMEYINKNYTKYVFIYVLVWLDNIFLYKTDVIYVYRYVCYTL